VTTSAGSSGYERDALENNLVFHTAGQRTTLARPAIQLHSKAEGANMKVRDIDIEVRLGLAEEASADYVLPERHAEAARGRRRTSTR